MLEIKDLSVRYGKQAPTIEHFNLNMKKGERSEEHTSELQSR